MLRDRWTRDIELRGDLPRGELPIGHEAQDAAPPWLGNCSDSGFHDKGSFSMDLRKAQLTEVGMDSIERKAKGAAWPS
jgi:hypothetical protein